jgi:hypothetical protein
MKIYVDSDSVVSNEESKDDEPIKLEADEF